MLSNQRDCLRSLFVFLSQPEYGGMMCSLQCANMHFVVLGCCSPFALPPYQTRGAFCRRAAGPHLTSPRWISAPGLFGSQAEKEAELDCAPSKCFSTPGIGTFLSLRACSPFSVQLDRAFDSECLHAGAARPLGARALVPPGSAAQLRVLMCLRQAPSTAMSN